MVQASLDPPQSTGLENPRIFDARFYRCYNLLVLIAGRVLSEPQSIDEAVYNSCG